MPEILKKIIAKFSKKEENIGEEEKKKITIFVDGDNFNSSRRNLEIGLIDFEKLEEILENFTAKSLNIEIENLKIVEKKYYIFEKKLSRAQNFLNYLKNLKYEIIAKLPENINIYHDIIRHGDCLKFDVLILVSINNNVLKKIKFIKKRRGRKTRIIIVNSKERLSEELKEISDAYFYLNDIKNEIKRSMPE